MSIRLSLISEQQRLTMISTTNSIRKLGKFKYTQFASIEVVKLRILKNPAISRLLLLSQKGCSRMIENSPNWPDKDTRYYVFECLDTVNCANLNKNTTHPFTPLRNWKAMIGMLLKRGESLRVLKRRNHQYSTLETGQSEG